MKRLFRTLFWAALPLLWTAGWAQQSVQKLEGIWMFRATFPGVPAPAYVGTARFLPDGTFQGPGPDQHTGLVSGQWTRVGNAEFAFTFVADSYDSSGNFIYTSRVRGMLTVGGDGLSGAGKTIVEKLDTTGKVIFTSDPTPFTGSRLVVQAF